MLFENEAYTCFCIIVLDLFVINASNGIYIFLPIGIVSDLFNKQIQILTSQLHYRFFVI